MKSPIDQTQPDIDEDSVTPKRGKRTFTNPFQLTDLLIFDEPNLSRILEIAFQEVKAEELGECVQDTDPQLIQHIQNVLSGPELEAFRQGLSHTLAAQKRAGLRRALLDSLFWELTYWKTPELYEELTQGEQLHPGIFEQLEPLVRGKIVLDAGAGSGRASLEALRHGAKVVYAVEPSPGLLHLLQQKIAHDRTAGHIQTLQGDFACLPLSDRSVDVALSCAAFTSNDEQGGERGLAELLRVTRSGGYVVLVWPRRQDRAWLAEHGFNYVVLPGGPRMEVHFSSFQKALHCARLFYATNKRVMRYLLKKRQPEIPFSVLGFNPPCDYCWRKVESCGSQQ